MSDLVSGMQSTYAEDSPDCTNNLIVGDAGPTQDSVSTVQTLAMLYETWEIEKTFTHNSSVFFFVDGQSDLHCT